MVNFSKELGSIDIYLIILPMLLIIPVVFVVSKLLAMGQKPMINTRRR